MKTRMYYSLLILFFAAFRVVIAQDEGNFREKIDDLRKKKLLEDLNLSKEKSEAFLKIYDAFIDQERNLHRDKRDVFKKLVHISALGDEIPDNSIMKTIDRVNEIDMKIVANHVTFVKEMEKKLNAAEIARVVVFEQNFQMKMREKVFDIRSKKNKRYLLPPPPFMEEDLE